MHAGPYAGFFHQGGAARPICRKKSQIIINNISFYSKLSAPGGSCLPPIPRFARPWEHWLPEINRQELST
jgi:hypothetical protein